MESHADVKRNRETADVYSDLLGLEPGGDYEADDVNIYFSEQGADLPPEIRETLDIDTNLRCSTPGWPEREPNFPRADQAFMSPPGPSELFPMPPAHQQHVDASTYTHAVRGQPQMVQNQAYPNMQAAKFAQQSGNTYMPYFCGSPAKEQPADAWPVSDRAMASLGASPSGKSTKQKRKRVGEAAVVGTVHHPMTAQYYQYDPAGGAPSQHTAYRQVAKGSPVGQHPSSANVDLPFYTKAALSELKRVVSMLDSNTRKTIADSLQRLATTTVCVQMKQRTGNQGSKKGKVGPGGSRAASKKQGFSSSCHAADHEIDEQKTIDRYVCQLLYNDGRREYTNSQA